MPMPTDPGDWVTAADLANPDLCRDKAARSTTAHGTERASPASSRRTPTTAWASPAWTGTRALLPVRVLGKCVGYDSDILDGVTWAAGLPVPGVPANPNPAQVINLSLGGPDACRQALSRRLPAGARARRDARDRRRRRQRKRRRRARRRLPAAPKRSWWPRRRAPARWRATAISAPASRSRRRAVNDVASRRTRSSRFRTTGRRCRATTATATRRERASAAPIVSGVVSLMLSVAPNLTAAQVRALLRSSAKPFPAGSTCNTTMCGAGIVDARAAVAAAQARAAASGINYQGLWWRAGGHRIGLGHQSSRTRATRSSRPGTPTTPPGKAWWLSMLATRTTGENFSGVIYTTNGPPFNNNTNQTCVQSADGPSATARSSFTDANNGSFTYTVNAITQTKPLARYDLGTGPAPTCTYSDVTPDFAARDELPGPVVGRQRRRIGLGRQLRASGQRDLRDLVHLRRQQRAALAVRARDLRNGAATRARCTGRPARRSMPTMPASGSATPVGTASARLRRRQPRDVRLHDERAGRPAGLEPEQADHALPVRGRRAERSVTDIEGAAMSASTADDERETLRRLGIAAENPRRVPRADGLARRRRGDRIDQPGRRARRSRRCGSPMPPISRRCSRRRSPPRRRGAIVPAPKRGEAVRRLADLLREHKDALGTLVALENGKIKAEGDGEVQEMIDIADLAVGQSRMLYGKSIPSERPQHRMSEQWHPLGVVGVITAFNFPVAVWAWNAMLAAVCGNAVVWKPSPKTPLTAIAVQHLANRVDAGDAAAQRVRARDLRREAKHRRSPPIRASRWCRSPGPPRSDARSRASGRRRVSARRCSNAPATTRSSWPRMPTSISWFRRCCSAPSARPGSVARRRDASSCIARGRRKSCAALKHAYAQVAIGDSDASGDADGAADRRRGRRQLRTRAIVEARAAGGEVVCGGRVLPGPGFWVEPTIITGVDNAARVRPARDVCADPLRDSVRHAGRGDRAQQRRAPGTLVVDLHARRARRRGVRRRDRQRLRHRQRESRHVGRRDRRRVRRREGNRRRAARPGPTPGRRTCADRRTR